MQQTAWGPRTVKIAGCGGAGTSIAIACVTLDTDTPGCMLAGIAAISLILFAGLSWRARPKLAINPDGLAVQGWFRTQLFGPADIKIIRIIKFRRFGHTVRLLEIEAANGDLVILSRWDLGTEPREVLDTLTAAGYAGRKNGKRRAALKKL